MTEGLTLKARDAKVCQLLANFHRDWLTRQTIGLRVDINA